MSQCANVYEQRGWAYVAIGKIHQLSRRSYRWTAFDRWGGRAARGKATTPGAASIAIRMINKRNDL